MVGEDGLFVMYLYATVHALFAVIIVIVKATAVAYQSAAMGEVVYRRIMQFLGPQCA